MQEQFDAVLYLGPKSEITYAELPKSLCADPEYVEMVAARLSAMRRPGHPPRDLLAPTTFAGAARMWWRAWPPRSNKESLAGVSLRGTVWAFNSVARAPPSHGESVSA
jgi:hypothetical protein